MKLLFKLLGLPYLAFCKLWNYQYYFYPAINSKAVFAPAFPGLIKIISPQNCSIGEGTIINANTVIHCAGGVVIGSHVHIGHGFCLYSSNHNFKSTKSIPYDATEILKPVKIGDCVWIGAHVSVVPGVTIGEGAVIGMGSVVTKDIPTCAIVGGNPTQELGYRDKETYFKLKAKRSFF